MKRNNSSADLIWCAVPVFNNGATVKGIASECRLYLNNVLVVDDGSTDADISGMFAETDISVIHHKENRGKGEAIMTAAKYIAGKGGLFMITIDADGQHYPKDLDKFVPLLSDDDSAIVIGCRNFNAENIPKSSRFGRKFANFWLRIETGVSIGDCQSGFRAYPVKQLLRLKLHGARFDFESEVLARAVWAGLELKTVEVDVWYPEPLKRISAFRPVLDNIRISIMHARLVGRRILQKTGDIIRQHIEPKQQAHSPLLAAGLASELNTGNIPYDRRFPAACGGELQKVEKRASRKRGTRFGFRVFEFFLRTFGLHRTYGLLYFVCIYYLFFDREAVSSARAYIERRFPESLYFTRYLHIYRLFVSQGKQLVDRFAAVASKQDLFDIRLNGYDELMAVLRNSDKGAVLLTSHFGNWQIALTTLNKLDRKVYLLMRREDNPAVHDSLNIGREEGNIRIISPDQEFGGVIEMMSVLRMGDVVSIMGDRRYGSKSSRIRFLGDYAFFPFSAFAIAAAAECPVVVLLAAKVSDYEYTVDVSGIIHPRCNNGKKKNEQLAPWVQQYADILEKFTDNYPYQCFLFHDIWKDES